MNNRRHFLKQFGLVSAGGALVEKVLLPELENALDQNNQRFSNYSAIELAREEDFWQTIKDAYQLSPDIMNLNNGGVSPHPLVVEEAMIKYHRFSNEIPSFNMWRKVDKNREPLRIQLAELAGCDADEIAIQRNASEALETVIFGLPLKRGDEVILTHQDYPNMKNAWKQREKRDGIVLKWLDFDFPIENDKTIVDRFAKAITQRTKLLHVTHVINWMGQIMPVKPLVNLAHERNIEVLVDGAHSFAHLTFSIKDLGCDYFGTSLHKWLGAPFGTGMLYVDKTKIQNIYPLLAAPNPHSKDIRKFEHLGTRSFAIEQAIGQAIEFHLKIGSDRKQARLHHLTQYWASAVNTLPGISIGTSLDPKYGCGIALLQIDQIKPTVLAQSLYQKYKIHAVAMDYHNIHGVRITPNVYTLEKDLDYLIQAISEISTT